MNAVRIVAISCALALVTFVPLSGHAAIPAIVPSCEGADCSFADFVQLIKNVMGFLLAIAIPIFAIIFMWAGFLMVTAAGNTGKITKAKDLMTNAFLGFIVALGAYLFVNLLTNFFLKKDARDVLGVRGTISSYEIA